MQESRKKFQTPIEDDFKDTIILMNDIVDRFILLSLDIFTLRSKLENIQRKTTLK